MSERIEQTELDRLFDEHAICDLATRGLVAPIVTARIRLRNDDGPTGELSTPLEYALIDGKYYPLAWIKTGQGALPEQLEIEGCA
jgi:hypothetical protein